MNTQQQQTFDAMQEALEKLCGTPDDPNNGWHGHGGTEHEFVCEYCREIHEDCALMAHKPTCPIMKARAALTAAKEVTAQKVEPLIMVEASLRFSLESEQCKSADLLDEVRELKGKLAQQPAPAQRLSYAEIQMAYGLESLPGGAILRDVHAIETAFAAKNGITLEQK